MTNQSTTAGSNASSSPKAQEQTLAAPAPSTSALTTPSTALDSSKQALLQEIHVKWDKFSEQEARDLKSNDDLVVQLVAKYGLAKDVAQHDADTLRAGRNI